MSTVVKPKQQNAENSHEKKVICKKCKSPQIVANKRGFSFARMFITLFLILVIGILYSMSIVYVVSSTLDLPDFTVKLIEVFGMLLFLMGIPLPLIMGFMGRSKIVNGCMNCGNKWMPGKR